jgi:hypothetical protein
MQKSEFELEIPYLIICLNALNFLFCGNALNY